MRQFGYFHQVINQPRGQGAGLMLIKEDKGKIL
ncbi:hypothetical protein SDC9_110994 [bioreactor metagenome]|uniref:Uncharacterized protein n=1 Tax=bioreactor metagenome TaxID=1076179 RepID=A0A645BGB8_9ZZZZ